MKGLCGTRCAKCGRIWRARQDSYEAGRCQAPFVFSAVWHTSIFATPRNDPHRDRRGSALFDDENRSGHAADSTTTLKSWRLRFAGAVWLPRLLLSVSVRCTEHQNLMGE